MFDIPGPLSEFPHIRTNDKMGHPPSRLSHNWIDDIAELSPVQIGVRAAHLSQQAGFAESREGRRALRNAKKLESLLGTQVTGATIAPHQGQRVEIPLQPAAGRPLDRLRGVIERVLP
jgi:hypothetical protein